MNKYDWLSRPSPEDAYIKTTKDTDREYQMNIRNKEDRFLQLMLMKAAKGTMTEVFLKLSKSCCRLTQSKFMLDINLQ